MIFKRPYRLVVITLFPLAVSTLFLYFNLSRVLRAEMISWEARTREEQTSQIVKELQVRVNIAWDIIEYYDHQGLGQEACKKALASIDRNQDGYIYVQQVDPANPEAARMVVHPDVNFVGREVAATLDLERVREIYYRGKVYPLGHPTVAEIKPTNVSAEINRVCLKEGGGVIHYYWDKVVDGKASQIGYPKIAYVRYFPQWQWAIGSGAYADHIDGLVAKQMESVSEDARHIRDLLLSSTLIVTLLLGVISLGVSRTFSRKLVQFEESLLASRERLTQEVEKSRHNERFIGTLLTNLPQKIVLKDKQSNTLYCNEQYAESLHRTVEETIGKNEYDLYPRMIANKYIASDRAVIDENKAQEGFLRRRLNGQDVITRVLKTPVRTEGGQVEGVLCLFEDFTERIQNEERLKAANAELEETNRRVRETQAYLIQSEKMASIGQLAAGIAHEINNPMSYVVGNSHALDEYVASMTRMLEIYQQHVAEMASTGNSLCDEHACRIQDIRNELDINHICSDVHSLLADSQEGMSRVLRIVQNLRTFSRIDQANEVSPFDLNGGIRSTLVIASNELKDKAQVTTELGDIPEIYCHSGEINQVILNILVNAAQAIASQERDGLGNIAVRTSCEEDEVVCAITDDGPGIPQENLRRIFDPFFTTKPIGQGTGLGLHISYDIIVRKHGGKLRVESEPGKGAAFIIRLPINRASTEDLAKGPTYEREDSVVC